jgi:predicted nucleic acid-binding protein
MAYVIDASVALKLFLPEADSPLAERLVVRAPQLLAPDLLLIEAANGLWSNARRSRTNTSAFTDKAKFADEAIKILADGRIELVDSDKLASLAFKLALELDHPVYDCTYLALAIEEDKVFVTADKRFLSRIRETRTYESRVLDLQAADALP